MKILHFSDYHLGMENYGTVDSKTGLPSRYADFLRSLDFMIDAAEEEKVDAIIFSGDAFKTRDPTPTQQREFAKRILKLARIAPVVLLVGNHDLPTATARADSLSIFDTLEVPNVHVLARITTITLDTKSGPLQVVGVPWILRSHFLTFDEYKDLPLNEVNSLLAGTVAGIVERQLDVLDEKIPAVVTAHASVTGATFGSERSIMLGSDVPLPLGSLSNENVQYVALGHIHKHQVLQKDPPVIYAGSMERIDFGEEKEPKGFVIATIDVGKPTRWEYFATPARDFLTIDVNIPDDCEDPMPLIFDKISGAKVEDKVVRIKVDIPSVLRMQIDDAEIKKSLKEASYFAGIEKTQRLSHIVRRPDLIALEQTPIEALEKYLELKKLPAKRREKLIRMAEEIISADTDIPPQEKG